MSARTRVEAAGDISLFLSASGLLVLLTPSTQQSINYEMNCLDLGKFASVDTTIMPRNEISGPTFAFDRSGVFFWIICRQAMRESGKVERRRTRVRFLHFNAEALIARMSGKKSSMQHDEHELGDETIEEACELLAEAEVVHRCFRVVRRRGCPPLLARKVGQVRQANPREIDGPGPRSPESDRLS
ncbi:hypothetical protein BST61_g5250 [Cercospora zeina]